MTSIVFRGSCPLCLRHVSPVLCPLFLRRVQGVLILCPLFLRRVQGVLILCSLLFLAVLARFVAQQPLRVKILLFLSKECSKSKGHGNEADFLGFLQKLVPHRSLTLPFEPIRFWLRSATLRLTESGSRCLSDSASRLLNF